MPEGNKLIKIVIEFLIDRWDKYFTNIDKPQKISFLQLCGDSDYRITEKIEFFLFLNSNKFPSLVVNFTRHPEYTELLQNEYLSLKKLYSINSDFLKDSIPKPILYEKVGITDILITGYLAGRTMEQMVIKNRLSRKLAEIFFEKMGEWCINLNIHTKSDKIDMYEYAEHLLKEYILYYSSNKINFIKLLDSIKGAFVPSTFVHGNPAAGNILVDKTGLKIVDWAVAREKGLPLSDLFIFLTWYGANYFRTGDFQGDYRMTFFDSNPFSSMARNMVYYYCERAGIDKKIILPLFYLTWIEYSARKFRYMAINSGYEVSLLDYNQIAPDIVKHIWDNFPEPNRNLPILHILDNRPVNIQMLFDEERNFIL